MPARTREDAARRIITNEYPVRGPLPRYMDDPVDPLDPSGAIRPRARQEYPANRLINPRSAADEWNRVIGPLDAPPASTPFGGSAVDPNNTPRVPEQIDTITQAGALLDYVESVESWGFDERDIVTRLLRFMLKEMERINEQSAMDHRAVTVREGHQRVFERQMELLRHRIDAEERRRANAPVPERTLSPEQEERERRPAHRIDPDGSYTEWDEANGIETIYHPDGRIVRHRVVGRRPFSTVDDSND